MVSIRVPPGHQRLGCGRHIARFPDGAQVRTACGDPSHGFLPSGEGWVGGKGYADVVLDDCRLMVSFDETLLEEAGTDASSLVVGAPVDTPARLNPMTRQILGHVVLRTEHAAVLGVTVATYEDACTASVNEVIESIMGSLSGLPLRTHSVAEIPLTTTGETLLVEVPVHNILVSRGPMVDQYESCYQLRSINGAERATWFGHRGPTQPPTDSPSFETLALGTTLRFHLQTDILWTEDDDEERLRHMAELRTPDDQGTLMISLPPRTRLGARVLGTAEWGHLPIPEMER